MIFLEVDMKFFTGLFWGLIISSLFWLVIIQGIIYAIDNSVVLP